MYRYESLPVNEHGAHRDMLLAKQRGGNIVEENDDGNTMTQALPPTGITFETSPYTNYNFDRNSEAGVAYGGPGPSSPSNVSEEYDKFALRTLNDLWSGSRVPHFQDLAHAVYHQYYPDDGTLGHRAGREIARALVEVGAIPNDIDVIHTAEEVFRSFYAGERNILEALEDHRERSVRRHRRRAGQRGVNVVEDEEEEPQPVDTV